MPRAFLDRKECVCEVQRDRAHRLRKVLFDRFMIEQILKIMDKTDNIRDKREDARVYINTMTHVDDGKSPKREQKCDLDKHGKHAKCCHLLKTKFLCI